MGEENRAVSQQQISSVTGDCVPAQRPARFRRALKTVLRHLLIGMYYQAIVFDPQVAAGMSEWLGGPAGNWPSNVELVEAGDSAGQVPPPGHPECLVLGIPLSPAEKELWAELLGEQVPGRWRKFRTR
jgi:hypothetical protein